MLSVRGVSKTFRPRTGIPVDALKGVSLEVPAGTFVSVVGPSGCGKTTLLRMLNGLVKPDTGQILLSGAEPRPGPHAGFVFQSFRLLPWRTVTANIEFALEATGMSPAERRERALHYLALVGLTHFGEAYPSELSGGMKQRIALARALAVQPEVLLMDEPFASLDAQTRELMQIELLRLWEAQKSMVVFVTHSVDEAILLSDKIVLMKARPGEIVEVLDIALPRPRWDYDVRNRPEFIEMRQYLWNRIKEMVLADAESGFAGAKLATTASGD